MRHGLSNFLGAIAAWLCLAPVAFAYEPLSMQSTLAAACTPAHYVANLSLFLIWITGGIFLLVGGILAFVRFRFRARQSDPLSGSVNSGGDDLRVRRIPIDACRTNQYLKCADRPIRTTCTLQNRSHCSRIKQRFGSCLSSGHIEALQKQQVPVLHPC